MGDICDLLEDLAGQWRTIATSLRLRDSSMNIIEVQNRDDVTRCLQLAIADWLKLKFNHERSGPPSWRMLAKAVRKLDGRLFDKIIREHPAGIGIEFLLASIHGVYNTGDDTTNTMECQNQSINLQ